MTTADTDIRLASDYYRALDRLRQPPWRKLFDPGLRTFIARRNARRAPSPVTVRVPLFFGASMNVVLPEVISEQLHGYGLFDDVVTWMALCAVEPGDTVFDVGAHFGYFSLLFAALAGPSGRVFSFEPTPSTFAVLASNAHGDSRIHPIKAAAGATAGRLSIADYGLKYSAWNTLAGDGRLGSAAVAAAPVPVEVEVLSLDAFADARGLAPGFLKIDAENYETEVLQGAARQLDSHRPTLLLEAGSPRAADLASTLAAAGYRAFSTSTAGELREVADAAEAGARFKDVLLASGDRASRLLPRAQRLAAAKRLRTSRST